MAVKKEKQMFVFAPRTATKKYSPPADYDREDLRAAADLFALLELAGFRPEVRGIDRDRVPLDALAYWTSVEFYINEVHMTVHTHIKDVISISYYNRGVTRRTVGIKYREPVDVQAFAKKLQAVIDDINANLYAARNVSRPSSRRSSRGSLAATSRSTSPWQPSSLLRKSCSAFRPVKRISSA